MERDPWRHHSNHLAYIEPRRLGADDFAAVREALEARFGAAEDARLDWKPQTTVAVDEAVAETLMKLLEALDDNDDVQRVAANFDVADDVLERLSA